MTGPHIQQGYILLPVALAIMLVAAVAFMINHESALETNISGGELEAAQAVYLAQAGVEHATWLAHNSGCAGDLTLSPTGMGAHSYQARVESAATNTTRYTFYPDRDGWIKEVAPDENFGTDSVLGFKNKAGDSFRAVYHFDLSSVPAGSQVVAATARFYVTANDSEGAVGIHALNGDWTESGVTWNGIATHYDSQVFGHIPPGSAAGVWVALNFTALAQTWVNDPSANHGILLVAGSIDLESKYTIRKHPPELRPYLEVTTAEGKVSPLSIGATGTLDRMVSLHEAEAGGADIESLHVRTDARSTIQWLHSDVSDAHQFHLLGWWDVSGP